MSIENIISELPVELRLRLERDAERAKLMTSGAHLQEWLDYEVSFWGIRSEAMRLTYSNQPKGRAYNEMVAHLKQHYGFDHLDGECVTAVLWLTDPEEKYRDGDKYVTRKEILSHILKNLTPGQRSRLASPASARQRVLSEIKRLKAAETGVLSETADEGERPLSKLKETEQQLAKALQEKDALEERLKRSDGSLFDLKDTPAKQIADVILATVTDYKANEIQKHLAMGVAEKRKTRKVPKAPAG